MTTNRNRRMARTVALTAVVTLAVAGCGGSHKKASPPAPRPAATTTTSPAPSTSESTAPTSTAAPTTAAPTPTSTVPATTTTTAPATTTTVAGGSIYASEARTEASQACSVLSGFDASVVAAVQADHAKGGDTTAAGEPGAAAAAASAYASAYQAHVIATAHLPGRSSTTWDQFALTFALLDASLGGDPGNGITSPTDPATASSNYSSAAQVCGGTFGSTFPTLSS